MATSKHIGMISCPHCGSDQATVHQQRTGNKKGALYYRCYSEIGGMSQRCGTIQCLGPTGQEYIRANMRPIAQPEPAGEPIGSALPPNPQETPPQPGHIDLPPPEPQKAGGGFMDWLMGGDDDE